MKRNKFPSTSIVLLHAVYKTHKAMKIVELLPTWCEKSWIYILKPRIHYYEPVFVGSRLENHNEVSRTLGSQIISYDAIWWSFGKNRKTWYKKGSSGKMTTSGF